MNATEILEKIQELFNDDISEFAYTSDFEHDEVGFKEVAKYGGEGKGELWYSVKFFPKHNIYIRVDGFYSSYHGTDFEDGWGNEVKPQEKIITVYE